MLALAASTGTSLAASHSSTPRSFPSVPRTAIVAFLPSGRPPTGATEDRAIEQNFDSIPSLSVGILSATQGAYTNAQLVLDITQGARVSPSAYNEPSPPFLGLSAEGQVQGWPAALARARSAPQLLSPGLFAAQVPGGGAYIRAAGAQGVDGAVAADRGGHVAAILASSTMLAKTVDRLRARHRLIVVDLPPGPSGHAGLAALASHRPPGELLVAIQRPIDAPNNTTAGQAGHELLWSAVAGLGPGGQTLTSQTTNQRGLIAAIDIAPTVLDHLGLPIPADMRGRPIRTDGPFDSGGLRALKSRLGVIASRRIPAISWLIAAWALLLTAASLPFGASGRNQERGGSAARPGGRRARSNWAMRVGALAMLWIPAAVLVPATIEPSRGTEFTVLVVVCFTLGALTDRLMPWPRAPLVPAVVTVLALSVDALAGTQLLMRSLLGPNPAFGARFYGIGNELKSVLAVLVFAAVAAALYPSARSRGAATAMASAGILLTLVEGSARIGAGVGGVILVSAGTAVATVMLLPGKLNRRRLLLVVAAPLVGLLALAALDLATAHGGGHFTGSVLDARSAGDIRDIIVRRYGAAYDELGNHLMPFATALAVLASGLAVRRHKRVCAPVGSDPAWVAALAGGLTAGAIGALTEDSGPVLLVVAVFVLGCVLSYLWGKPLGGEPLTQRSPGTLPSARSRALRRPRAHAG